MLETIDTKKHIEKDAYREWFPRLKTDLRELQQKAREARLPVFLVFEGFQYAGKADAIRHLSETLDPRGFSVHSIYLPTEEDRQRHWMWRYWVRFPPRGKIALFERSWYNRVLRERAEKQVTKEEWSHAYQEINQMEEKLTADGALIIKFWMHISRKQQRKRFKDRENDPFRKFDLANGAGKPHKLYDRYLQAAEETLERTSTHMAPWLIVESGDPRFRRMKIYQTICEKIVRRLNRVDPAELEAANDAEPVTTLSIPALKEMPTVLDAVDHSKTVPEEEYEKAKLKLQYHLRKVQFRMVQAGMPMLMVFEGWDAAGKGGNIRRLTATLDPRFYDVISIGKPTPEELAHHYLWRFWRHVPRAGHLTIFDRSHYGRVIVERIEGFCTEREWRRAYQEINEFELMLYRSGMPIIKFWIDISKDEQMRRFKARENDPHRRHKLTDEDWRNREKWDLHREAVDDMIRRTSTTYAPWTIVEGNCKRHARVRTMETVIEVAEEALKRR